jgi:Carboxypeptidase regulatory-like domain/TonB dependent receptor
MWSFGRCTGLVRLLLFIFVSASCFAQFNSSIQGDATDPSGAGVAKATVTLTNTATQVTQTTTADNAGNFKFVSLGPSTYDVTVTAPGFSKTSVNVSLTTGQNLNLPIKLSLASASTSVVVTAAAPVLDTAETRNQETIRQKELNAVPLSGRNMISLVTLAPGVSGRGLVGSGVQGAAGDNFSTEQSVDASANGRSSNANMYVVDGLDVTSNIRPGVVNLSPNPDSIQEETTAVNTFSTEYGRGSSVVYTMTTKSGSDQFHGLVSDYFTYQGLYAGTEFSHTYQPFHLNNMSANIGGPIIPHKQLFFFFGVEPLRSSQAVVSRVTVEDPQFTAFAQQHFPNTIGTNLLTTYRPTGASVTGVSQTAAQAFSGCGTAATAFIPCNLPVFDSGVQSASAPRDAIQYNGRVDKNFQNDRLYGTFFLTRLNTGTTAVRPQFSTTNSFYTNSVQGNYTHTFSPTVLNEAYFGYLTVDGINNATGDFRVPTIGVTGMNTPTANFGAGSGFAQGEFIQHNYHWRDVLTIVKDTHTVAVGYDGWHGNDLAYFAPVHTSPNFQFNNLLDLVQDKPYTESNLAYNPITGQPAPGQYGYQTTTGGIFAQDTWKAASNLTLTYGLRWDNFGNPYPALPGTVLANFHLGPGTSFNQQVTNGYMQQQGHVLNEPLWYAFAPRIGVAWDPSKDGKWVIRGGFGVYHDMPTLGNLENSLNGNPPGFITPTFYNDGTTSAPIFQLGTNAAKPEGFLYPAIPARPLDAHGGVVGLQNSVGGVDVNLTVPTTFNYAATLEHKLFGNVVGSVGYQGSSSYNIINGYGQTGNTAYGFDINRFSGDLIQSGLPSPRRLNPSFGAITYQENAAEARYNAVVTNIRGHLFHERVYFNGSYTHSVSKDDSQYYPTYPGLSRYYGPSAWDTPDRFSLMFNYQFPNFHNNRGVVGRIASGWSISGTSVYQNGNPFNIYTSAPFADGGDYNADGVNFDFPNVSSYQLPSGRSNYLNGLFTGPYAGIYSAPPPGTEGNERYNGFRNPGFAETDAVLIKDTRIAEQVTLQLRFEFYNIFNHPNLQGVNTNISNGDFGRSTAQYTPRYIQFGARIFF